MPVQDKIYRPFSGYHFKVEFPQISKQETDIRFQSVGGLSVDLQTETVKEGGQNRFEHVLPVRAKYSNLVLKRGVLRDSDVIDWCLDTFENLTVVPTLVQVMLLNEEHNPLMTWKIAHAWPKKWSVADLNAESSGVLVETMEFHYHHFNLEVAS